MMGEVWLLFVVPIRKWLIYSGSARTCALPPEASFVSGNAEFDCNKRVERRGNTMMEVTPMLYYKDHVNK